VEDVAGKTLYACQRGQQEIQSVTESMVEVTGRVDTIAQKMLEFEERAREIESVLNLIRDVSEKTNMISLNASIESAAQGEAGVRFAIIAAEIRDLSERTVAATREIREMITMLQKSSSSAIIATEEGTKQVLTSQSKMARVSESFQNIIHLAGETARSAQEIAISSTQQTSASEHLAATIAEINEVAKNFVESANQIERNTAELNTMAEHIREIIAGQVQETRA
jgi:methyl-accepting chemotaxis protein